MNFNSKTLGSVYSPRTSALRCFAALLALTLVVDAHGQSNSLFRRFRARPAPATQPGGQPREILLGGAAPAPPVPAAAAANADPNPTLLHTSLIAVEVPPPKRIQVNDLVTIIIREDKRATSDSKLQNDKKWQIDTALAKWFQLDLHDRLVTKQFPDKPGVDFEYNDKYDTTGKVERQDSLTTRITANVIDVKPNGTLVLQARKTIKTDEDKQVMTLTGICRSEDVTAENTVLSTQLADAEIASENSGPARDAAKRGWIKRAFDWLAPL